jgi:hypothetical protein
LYNSIGTEKDKPQSTIDRVLAKKNHLLSFKEAMLLPAYQYENKLKMKMMKNSIDLDLREVNDVRKLNVFKVAKSLSNKSLLY